MFDVLERITQLREQRGWSEYELSVRSDLTQSTISTWYRKHQIPTVYSLEKICKGFGMTLSQFFWDEEESFLISPEQKALLDNFSALPPNVQQDIKSLISNILANQ